MPVIQNEVAVGAGASNNNLCSGSAFEYARGRSALSLGVNASATGTFIQVTSGADVILEDSPPYIATVYPIIPDQMFYNDIMEPMDRLRIAARNTSGGSITERFLAIISQL